MFSLFATPAHCAPATAEPSLGPLFRLLDDFESYNRQAQGPRRQQQQQRRPSPRTQLATSFRPRFDVRETETAYELHGDLAGLERENVSIEFADPQTIVIRGRVERSYDSSNEKKVAVEPAAEKQPEQAPEQEPEQEPETAATDADETSSNTSSNWHHATVEDDPEEVSIASVATPAETPKAAAVETAKTATPTPTVPADVEKVQPQKFWLVERSVGEFERAFEFPTRVAQDGVTANLQDGVLSVIVPKAKKHEVRRVVIF
ncbi:HSP20-like chaperone [Lasiosphaeris hirsuta]|uniref:HSP20-like chaperone n=1 Tax=Lasiosphaeris hirsuta TaxID=260670 RepID=A0AA40A164_9PEZI|nr:HSP20-like chaperone [Lasiosphaeris hirsuta]